MIKTERRGAILGEDFIKKFVNHMEAVGFGNYGGKN